MTIKLSQFSSRSHPPPPPPRDRGRRDSYNNEPLANESMEQIP